MDCSFLAQQRFSHWLAQLHRPLRTLALCRRPKRVARQIFWWLPAEGKCEGRGVLCFYQQAAFGAQDPLLGLDRNMGPDKKTGGGELQLAGGGAVRAGETAVGSGGAGAAHRRSGFARGPDAAMV